MITRVTRREAFFVALVILAFGIAGACAAGIRGSLWVPRNDDWVYLHMAQWFHSTGTFVVESGSLTNAIGLVLLTQPVISLFGDSVVTLQIFVTVLGAVGLFVLWLILRRFLNRGFAVIACLPLVLSPLWLPLQFSFMTDVPAFTFEMLALLVAMNIGSLKTLKSWLTLLLSLTLSFIAFSIREYALVVGLAIVLWVVIEEMLKRNGKWLLVVAISGLWLIACVALFAWRSSLPLAGGTPIVLSFGQISKASSLAFQSLVFVSLCCLPVALSFSPRRLWLRLSLSSRVFNLSFVALFLGIGIYLHFHGGLGLGNYLTEFGAYAGTMPIGSAPSIFSPKVMSFIFLVGLGSGAMLLHLLVGALQIFMSRDTPSRDVRWSQLLSRVQSLLGLFVAGTFIGVWVLTAIASAPMMDRYFLPILPLFASIALWAIWSLKLQSAWFPYTSMVGAIFIGFISSIVIDSANVIDGAKWRMGNELVSMGFSAETIDGGYEWFGYHQQSQAVPQHMVPIQGWWTTLYENPRICAQVGLGNKGTSDPNAIASFTVRNWVGISIDAWAIRDHQNCQ